MNELSGLKSSGEVDEFMELIYEIIESNDMGYLPYLFKFFQELHNVEGIGETLKNIIETHPADIYVTYLLRTLKEQYQKIHDECKYMFWGIFNDLEYFEVLKKNIHLADRETLLKLLNDIYEDKYSLPEHKTIVNELRKLLNSDK